ncbi:FmdB family zinc ribbon protein [Deinococcus yavapaiensis]|uniref:Putative FmdB family regulatory protein n=1 Tax=Deinococcus yavapaiensis KR-236 TaxID=694435 RepID=A0A318RZ26_9DEIO|nr:FmdB family zinc ribbon protein [Deinococcus yavapaiensis]PYE48953.1 putative FmdB family regulatory protein [Deinococcus yavapaiensis KR-236]
MPTYQYKNLETGELYEIKQSMTEAPLTAHPETGAPIKRILSRPGIAFKGSGFYVTDSRPAETSKASGE